VLEELQELAATLSACGAEQEGADSDEAMAVESKAGSTDVGDRGWTVRIFCEIGFTYGTLVETLVETLDRWQGKSPEKLLHLLASIAFALMQWTRLAAE
jgi:metal-dependent amidase/aminoacylase/carboxypeptidase family protein